MQLAKQKKCEAGGHLHTRITDTSPATPVRFKLKFNAAIYCVLLKHLFINHAQFIKSWIMN